MTNARVLHGIGVSPGAVAGPVVRLAGPPPDPVAGGAVDNPAAEVERALAALAEVAAFLRARGAAAGGAAADVLDAQAMMAADPALADRIAELVAAGRSAARAVHEGLIGYAEALRAVGGYLGERVADLDDIRFRAVALLTGVAMPGVPLLDRPSVLLARDLAPADTATLDRAHVLGFVTELGGPTSHTAILAKQLAIPAVVGCPDAAHLRDGDQVVVDGTTGQRPVGVCGEAAADPLLALVLVGLGVTSLSMAPGCLPAVRRALAAHTLGRCGELAQAAREAEDPASARAAVRRLVDRDLPTLP